MKLTISNKQSLYFVPNPIQDFGYVGSSSPILSISSRLLDFLGKWSVNRLRSLHPLEIWFFLFEKLSVMFLEEEVHKWEQEKQEWMLANDEVSKLL